MRMRTTEATRRWLILLAGASLLAGAPSPIHIEPAEDGMTARIVVVPPEAESSESPHGKLWSLAGGLSGLEPGAPNLPRLVRVIPGKPGFRAALRVLAEEFDERPAPDVAPVAARKSSFEADDRYRHVLQWERDPAVYGRDAFWPSERLSVDQALMGTNAYVRIECRPLTWNPATRKLRLYKRIVAELSFVPP